MDHIVAESVERIDRDLVRGGPDEFQKPLLHRIDAGLGERQRQNTIGRRVGRLKNIGDTERENMGFPGPRPCHHHDRPFNGLDRELLRRIEPAQHRFKCWRGLLHESSISLGRF